MDDEINRFVGQGIWAPAPNTNVPSHAPVLEQKASASPGPDHEPESKWASTIQLDVFRAMATKILEEYINKKGVKFRKGRKSTNVIRGHNV